MSNPHRRSLHGRNIRPPTTNRTRSCFDPPTVPKHPSQTNFYRDEGIVLLSGGLTIHTFKEWNAWDPKTAPQGFMDFEKAVVDSVQNSTSVEERNEDMKQLMIHPFFERAHPREEHFVPIYIAAGAGSAEGEGANVLSDIHSAISIAFGL